MTKLKKFKLQENQYSRPYHHLVDFGRKKTFDYLYWGLEYYGYSKFIINLIDKISPNKKIAEVGCGDGKISIEIAKRYTKSIIDGYDLAHQAISFARSYGYGFKNCNFYDVDFSNSKEKYDIILLIEVIEHIPDSELERFIGMISKKLNKNGKLLISVPTTNVPLNSKHYRHYTKKKLMSHISNYFYIEKTHYIHNENSIMYKCIRSILINRFFILNSNKIRSLFYKYYEKNLMISNSNEGAHLITICKKIK